MTEANDLDLDLPVRPEVQLVGQDGNAFYIIGLATNALKQAMRDEGFGWKEVDEQKYKLQSAMTSGDYDHLLAVVAANFEVG